MKVNVAKQNLLAGKTALGAVLMIPSPDVAKPMARSFEFLVVDAQHSGWDLATAAVAYRNIFQAGSVPMVRVTQNDPYAIGSQLDRGALGVIVPMVETAAEAEQAAWSARYGPRGRRSVGGAGLRDWLPLRHEELCEEIFVAVQIETRRGVENAEAILAVDGVDGCWVGPSDLALSLGLGVEPATEQERKTHEEAIAAVLAACWRTGKVPGICGAGPDDRWLRNGFRFVTVGVDNGCLDHGARALSQSYAALRQELAAEAETESGR